MYCAFTKHQRSLWYTFNHFSLENFVNVIKTINKTTFLNFCFLAGIVLHFLNRQVLLAAVIKIVIHPYYSLSNSWKVLIPEINPFTCLRTLSYVLMHFVSSIIEFFSCKFTLLCNNFVWLCWFSCGNAALLFKPPNRLCQEATMGFQ